jgi:hypothetical protein
MMMSFDTFFRGMAFVSFSLALSVLPSRLSAAGGGVLPALPKKSCVCDKRMEPSTARSGSKFVLLGGELFKPVQSSVSAPSFVYGFDSDDDAWRLPGGFEIRSGEGRNGTKALHYERRKPDEYVLAFRKLDLKPDTVYSVSVWIRTKEVVQKNEGGDWGGVCVEFSKNGKWSGGVYPTHRGEFHEWRRVEFKFKSRGPEYASTVTFYLRKGALGEIWFDDLSVKPIRSVGFISYPLTPKNLVAGQRNKVLVKAFPPRRISLEAGTLALVASLKGDDSYSETRRIPKDGLCRFTLPATNSKTEIMNLSLVDLKRKLLFSSVRVVWNVVNSVEVSNGVILEPNGCLKIDGKPFLPVGCFLGNAGPKDLAKLRDGGFNCVLPYSSFSLNTATGVYGSELDKIKASVDVFDEYGLKVIFSLKDQYPWREWARWRLDDAKGLEAVTKSVVERVGRSPALLAWYVADEEISSRIDDCLKNKRLVNSIDPRHPIFSLTFRLDDFPEYAVTGDVMGVDVYPIRGAESHSAGKIVEAMDKIGDAGKPIWFVPQAFHWGVYKKNPERYRFPTEEEVRSMTILSAAMGAKGFIFYNYSDFKRAAKFADEKTIGERWVELTKVARLMRGLAPFILSPERLAPPQIRKVSTTGEAVVKAAVFKHDGQICVLVASSGPGKVVACLSSPAFSGKTFHSMFGRTKMDGDCLEFTGVDICSDVLMSEIASPSSKQMEGVEKNE